MEFNVEVFAENLRLARRIKGYTQMDAAERVGVARSTYAGYETGKRLPDVAMLQKLADSLGVSTDELLNREGRYKPGLIKEARAEYYVEPKMTVDEYFNMSDCQEYELVEGELIKKNAPGFEHQIIVGQIFMSLYQQIKGRCKKCEIITAPFCVVLSERNATVLQPDISVICDRSKLQDGVCMGPPDLVVEIVSKGNIRYDYVKKTELYDKYGLVEYWIVDPFKEMILIHTFEEKEVVTVIPFSEKVSSVTIKGLTLNLGKLLKEHYAQYE